MSRSSRDIDEARQRTLRYWYVDGVTEIAAGCIFVLTGLLFLLEALAPAGSLPPSFSSVALPIVIIIGVFVAGRAVVAVKERLTYPRTGYVGYRRRKGVFRIITGLIAAVTGAMVVRLLILSPISLATILPLLEGLIIGAFLLYLAHSLGLARFYALAIFSVFLGAVISLAGLGETLGLGVYFFGVGIALIISGGLTLQIYLKQTQPASKD